MLNIENYHQLSLLAIFSINQDNNQLHNDVKNINNTK